jgi:hypothetical protein
MMTAALSCLQRIDFLVWRNTSMKTSARRSTRIRFRLFRCLQELTSIHREACFFIAAFHNHIERLMGPAKRQRMATEGSHLRVFLGRLQQQPDGDSRFLKPGRACDRNLDAHKEYLYWLTRTAHITVDEARTRCPRSAFARESDIIRANWELLHHIAQEVYLPLSRGRAGKGQARLVRPELQYRLPSSAGQAAVSRIALPFKASAIFVTWFLELGLDMAEIAAGVAAGHAREDLAHVFRKSPSHQAVFKSFMSFVDDLVAQVGAQTFGMAMEVGLSGQSQHPAQCHLHLFASSATADSSFSNTDVKFMVIDPASLTFQGRKPQHIGSSKFAKSMRSMSVVAKAMYYVLCDKRGSVFQHGNFQPFEDVFCL